MNRCYCGNNELEEYSHGYSMCNKCHSLVSKHDFTSAIYDVKEENRDAYGKNFWESLMVKEAGVKDIDELIDLYIPERATYWLLKILSHVKLGGKVAEVGCGLGQLSYLLKASGFAQTAYDLSPQICNLISTKLNINVVCGELSSKSEQYDSIILMDVFEHLLDPEQFLEDCLKRLTKEGILVIQTPCYDAQYNYEEMKRYKPRFEHLLVEDLHIFLFSRESITRLLKKHGFTYVYFEPAFFGDDYDMFLFASANPINVNSKEVVNSYLNQIEHGRIIKALIKLFQQNEENKSLQRAIDNERNQLLEDVDKLTSLVNIKQVELEQYKRAAEERLANIEILSGQLREAEQAAQERLRIIDILTGEKEEIKEQL